MGEPQGSYQGPRPSSLPGAADCSLSPSLHQEATTATGFFACGHAWAAVAKNGLLRRSDASAGLRGSRQAL